MTRALAAWIGLAAAAALAWLAAGGPSPAAAVQEEAPVVGSARGDTLYGTFCASCHGADGRGRADANRLAPPLVGMEAARVDLVLRTGRMPPAEPDGSGQGKEWTDSDREALLSYMTAQFSLEGPLLDPEPGDPAAGREVFATHCAACHGYTGDGGVAGGGALVPRIVGLEPVVIAEAVRVGPFAMPRFAEEQISDEELSDLVGYLEEVAAEHTTPLGLGEVNPVYLSAFAALLALAMILSCLYLAGRVTMFPNAEPPTDDEVEGVSGE